MGEVEDAALPPGWAWARLGDIAVVSGGLTKNQSRNTAGMAEAPFLRVANVQAGRLDLHELHTIRASRSEIERLALRPKDLLIVEGNGSLSQIGRCAMWDETVQECIHQNHIIRVRMKSPDQAPWVLCWLSSHGGRNAIERLASSTSGLHTLSISKVEGLPVPLPPEHEQQRILDAIAGCLDDVEDVEAAMKCARERMADYRASLLHAACTGALTAGWRDANPHPEEDGPALLRRILAERRAAWERDELARLKGADKGSRSKTWKQRYPAAVDPRLASSSLLPSGWTWCRMEELGSVNTGATPSRSSPAYFTSAGIPWITSSEVRTSPIKQAREFITELALKETSCKINPAGSLVIALYGEGSTRGRCAILGLDAATNQALAVVRLQHVSPVTLEYIKMVVDRSYLLLRAQAAGGVQPNLSLGIVRDWLIPLPPLTEQIEIMRLLSDSAPDVETTPDEVADLRRSILHAAFSGRLVPQDSADEPASTLLARLRADAAPSNRHHRTTRAGARP